jgi:S-adenosyl-L-methionine hydrolase (adenosine-forming)
MSPLITLTTDFGLQDEFVGAMKGVILSICPTAKLIDITHDIRPQDIQHAALILQSSYSYFPKKSIHIAVVDPGVGTDRRIIALKQSDYLFLAPDNGILSPFFSGDSIAHQVTNTDFFLDSVSATFHGRDIFAPVAAHLAKGVQLDELGPRIKVNKLIDRPFSAAFITDTSLKGAVIDIDRFGNLVTNITQQDIDTFASKNQTSLILSLNGKEIRGIDITFGNAQPGAPVALLGSRKLLEIAVNQGSAAQLFNARIKDEISLSCHYQ